MSKNPDNSSDFAVDPNTTLCQNCHTPMPLGLRFCRKCGYRLGEGVAEYTETVRFADPPQASRTPGQPFETSYGLNNAMAPVAAGPLKKRRRMTGMTWMFIGLLLFFIGAAAFTAIVSPSRRPEAPPIMRAAPRSEVGLGKLESTDGGVTFEVVEPPGSPADRAGLVGGDIITSFDGRTVREDNDILEILQEIPAGKTIDVVYVRDGVTKTAKLTTIERAESDRLAKAFINRPEGRGRFGYDDDQSERVQIEGTNTFGVQVDAITPSMPADLAGVKNGDIIIEFDGVPIRTPGELVSRVRRAIPYSTVNVVLMRGTEKLKIPVKMGR